MHWITSVSKPDILNDNEIYYPLLKIINLYPVIPEKCDIAIFTSQNGIIDCEFNEAFVVGQKTADKIKGKQNINVFKNILDLKKALEKIKNRNIIYFRGRDITDDLFFLKKNNTLESIIIYEANFIETLPREILNLLENNQINEISIYSDRSMLSFIYLMKKYNQNISSLLKIVKMKNKD